MQKASARGLKVVVLSLILGSLLTIHPLRADDAPTDLPPPPEADSSAGAELPPPPDPGAPADATSEASAADTPPPDASKVETPPGEELPAIPPAGDAAANDSTDQANSEVPADSGLTDVPESTPELAGPSTFSSSSELKDVSMDDRIKSKDLVLWLSLGPSYGTLTSIGSYKTAATTATGANDAVGGLGYNAGIGFMLDNTFQFQFDFTGTPKTKNSTVDNAMFGFGPRLGFLTLMGVFGVQQGPDPTTDGGVGRIFSIGARAGLDLVLKHSPDSRTSIGLAPEVFFITPQGADGYNSMGVAVSLRIYGYENAF